MDEQRTRLKLMFDKGERKPLQKMPLFVSWVRKKKKTQEFANSKITDFANFSEYIHSIA
jgi:hypothetical protein